MSYSAIGLYYLHRFSLTAVESALRIDLFYCPSYQHYTAMGYGDLSPAAGGG